MFGLSGKQGRTLSVCQESFLVAQGASLALPVQTCRGCMNPVECWLSVALIAASSKKEREGKIDKKEYVGGECMHSDVFVS